MKEKIIQKATDLFLKLGFKSVTMDDIAVEMAISKKTIYTHFKNKQHLVKECTNHIMEGITIGIDEICGFHKDPIEELYDIKKFIKSTLEKDQSSAQFQLQKFYPEISIHLKKTHFEKMMECTRTNLKRGIEQGLYRANINVEFIARLYFVGIHGIRDLSIFPLKLFSPAMVNEEYLEYHLRAIVTKNGIETLNKFIKEHHSND